MSPSSCKGPASEETWRELCRPRQSARILPSADAEAPRRRDEQPLAPHAARSPGFGRDENRERTLEHWGGTRGLAGGSQRGGRTQGGQLPQHRQTAAAPGQAPRVARPPCRLQRAHWRPTCWSGKGVWGEAGHVFTSRLCLGRGRGRDRGHPPGETDSEEMEHFCLIGFLPWLARKQPTFNSSSRNYSKR